MKKILKISLYGLLILVLVVLTVIHLLYVTFSPDDKGVEVINSNLVYFQESYDDCRDAYLKEAQKVVGQYDQAELFSVRVPSEKDDGLFIDFLHLPPLQNSGKLLVISSGVHGVEGYPGSAVQQMFLNELLSTDLLSEMGILVIHGVNPYGFKYQRRVSENNVDLNRGSEVDESLFEIKNSGYGALYEMLNPHGQVSTYSLRNQFFYLIAISKMMKESMGVLRQAILQGQYEYPEGIYFGGLDFEPQIDSLQMMLPRLFEPYQTILNIDLHTGYGSRRVLHLFPNPVDDPDLVKKTEFVFEGHHIDWGNTDDFYTISGGFSTDFLSKINPDATYLYMVFEWGTFDTEKTFGSLKSLQKIINENQGSQYGYKNSKHEQRIKSSMLEAYYPESEAWRSEVMESGREMLKLVLKNYPEVD